MTSKQKKLVAFASVIVLMGEFLAPRAHAMHIMEGYLPVSHSILWFAVCIPFWIMGFIKLKKIVAEHPKAVSIIAISGAFIFVISSLKIPSVTGSCSHMTGTGLAAILFGPTPVAILGVIVLIFQAILLAHGGLTTLGANTFSMAIAGPIVAYLIFRSMSKAGAKKNLSVFLAASLGDLFTYCVTALQLAVAYPAAEGGIGTSIVRRTRRNNGTRRSGRPNGSPGAPRAHGSRGRGCRCWATRNTGTDRRRSFCAAPSPPGGCPPP